MSSTDENAELAALDQLPELAAYRQLRAGLLETDLDPEIIRALDEVVMGACVASWRFGRERAIAARTGAAPAATSR